MDPLREFRDALRNPLTRRYYERRLAKFFNFLGLPGDLENQARIFVERADPNYLRESIYSFILAQRERVERKEITAATLKNFVKAIKLFCEENELFFNWKKLAKRLPPARNHANDRAPTKEEILKMMEYPDRRIKPIILVMATSGIRIGAWDYLTVGDVQPIEKEGRIVAAKLTVYKGEPEQYTTFITPEAYFALKQWLDFRQRSGERLSDSSPLMRNMWDTSCSASFPLPKKLSSKGVKALLERAIITQGVAKRVEGQKRREWQGAHGLRKFFKTVLETSGIKTIFVECLMGHDLGLAQSYFKPSENELLEEYLKAVPNLTFFGPKSSETQEIEKLKKRVEELETQNLELKRKAEEIYRLAQKIRKKLGM
jgi:integrase